MKLKGKYQMQLEDSGNDLVIEKMFLKRLEKLYSVILFLKRLKKRLEKILQLESVVPTISGKVIMLDILHYIIGFTDTQVRQRFVVIADQLKKFSGQTLAMNIGGI